MNRLSPSQRAFIKSASKPQLAAFLAKGPAEVGQALNIKTGDIVYGPAIRGVRVGAETFAEPGDALRIAEAELLRLNGDDVERADLDEAALGIDGKNIALADRIEASEAIIAVREIFHLGLMLGDNDRAPDAMEEFFDDLADGELGGRIDGLDWLAKSLEIEDGGSARDAYELFFDEAHRHCTLGFLIKIARPGGITWHGKGGGCSYSWGFSKSRWFYGESLDEALQLGFDWAKGEEAAEKAKKPRAKKGASS